MNIRYIDEFDYFEDDLQSRVYEIRPNVFNDDRGYFSEVLKSTDYDFSWAKQINRSMSSEWTLRGLHAQSGKFCQGKLVEAINTLILDIIVDARPNSKTFRKSYCISLSPILQNKVWVPRGFLHSFIVPPTSVFLPDEFAKYKASKNAIFQYYCDNIFDKNSEIGINPLPFYEDMLDQWSKSETANKNIIYLIINEMFKDRTNILISDKDKNGLDGKEWMKKIKEEFDIDGKLWYK